MCRFITLLCIDKPSISSDDSEAIKPTKADNDEETFEIEDRPLEIAENPRTEGTRSSGRRAARNCMMRQRQVLRLTEDPSSEEEEMGRSRKRSRRDSDDDFSDEQGRKKKKSGAKRRPSTDKPPVTAYPVKLPLRPQTEERKVFMFSTNLANAAADAVEKHLVTSIIVYHCQHPSPTGYLCSSMPNVPQYSRRPGVMEGHPGQFIADPRMSGYSRPSMAPPPWDMTQMFAKQQAAVHSAVSTWQPPPFGVTDHTNNTSTQRLHNPSSQITYHPIHHPPNPFSQNPPGYPPAGGYRPLSHPPSHPMYAAFQGHIPTGVPSTQQQQQPGGPAAQLSFPDYSVEDLTQILVGGAASGAVTARPRPTTYGPSELYRAQGYEQGQVVGQPEQGTSPYGMQSGQYAYQSPPTGYPPRGQDVSGHMGREYFSSHPGMPRSHDMAMYQGVVREVASTDYHQPWGMHPRPATQPQQIQQEPQQRQTEMYNDHLRQQHPAYLRMSSPSMHTSNWPPPPPYATPQQPHERDTSGTPHDPMYQGRPQSSSNPPPRGTPTTPNTPHDVHHMWQPSGGGGSAPSDPLSHQMPTQQIDQHQETGRASGQASARSSVSGYSQADATGASTLLEMSSGVVKPGASQHPQSMAAFGSYPPGVDRSAGHMMTGPDSKYLHLVASSQPGLPLNSDPLSVLASLTDKQSPLPQTGLMHSDKGDDRHDMKGSSEGESNGSVGSSKRATCFSIENLTAPHRKDVPGMDPALNTTFTMSMAPSNMLAAGSPFPGINSIPHQGYPSQLPGWGAGNPGFQHPSQKAFHLLGSPYGAISETNHRTSEGGPQQASLADSQGDTSQQDS